jgi:hypothetical protein
MRAVYPEARSRAEASPSFPGGMCHPGADERRNSSRTPRLREKIRLATMWRRTDTITRETSACNFYEQATAGIGPAGTITRKIFLCNFHA